MSAIVKYNYTFAEPGGAWIERASGERQWVCFLNLIEEMGVEWLVSMTAKQGWRTGCWIECPTEPAEMPEPIRLPDKTHCNMARQDATLSAPLPTSAPGAAGITREALGIQPCADRNENYVLGLSLP